MAGTDWVYKYSSGVTARTKVVSDENVLLPIIFKFLPSLDLKKCCHVCSVWEKVAIGVLARRKFIQCFESANMADVLGEPGYWTLAFETQENVARISSSSQGRNLHCFVQRDPQLSEDDNAPSSMGMAAAIRYTCVGFPPWEGVTVRSLEVPRNFRNQVSEAEFNQTILSQLSLPVGSQIKAVVALSTYGADRTTSSILSLLKSQFSDFALGGALLPLAGKIQFFVFSGPNVFAASGFSRKLNCSKCGFREFIDIVPTLKENVPREISSGVVLRFLRAENWRDFGDEEVFDIFSDRWSSLGVLGENYLPRNKFRPVAENSNPQCECLSAVLYIAFY